MRWWRDPHGKMQWKALLCHQPEGSYPKNVYAQQPSGVGVHINCACSSDEAGASNGCKFRLVLCIPKIHASALGASCLVYENLF